MTNLWISHINHLLSNSGFPLQVKMERTQSVRHVDNATQHLTFVCWNSRQWGTMWATVCVAVHFFTAAISAVNWCLLMMLANNMSSVKVIIITVNDRAEQRGSQMTPRGIELMTASVPALQWWDKLWHNCGGVYLFSSGHYWLLTRLVSETNCNINEIIFFVLFRKIKIWPSKARTQVICSSAYHLSSSSLRNTCTVQLNGSSVHPCSIHTL